MRYHPGSGALLLIATSLAGCGQTEVLRTDGWRYSGTIEAADAATVTLRNAHGAVTIPRAEVVDYDLPGDRWMLVGGAGAVIGLGAVAEGFGKADPTYDYVTGGIYGGVGLALLGWGLWTWLDARSAWHTRGGDVALDPRGLVVRF